MNMKRRRPSHVSIRAGQVEFVKVNTDAWRWRDVYRWLLGLNWPRFAAFLAGWAGERDVEELTTAVMEFE